MTYSNINKTELIGYFGACCLLASGVTATAQPLEEILVTAGKRGGLSVQDVPIAIQSIGGDQLKEMGAADFNDYYRQVPGLSVNDQGPGDKRYIIRGISSRGQGTVGLYLDEVIITGENLNTEGGRQPDIKLFDIDRIEVLKGPQGTTFGSSSLSGTIRWIPAEPDMNQRSADIAFGTGRTRHSNGTNWNVEGMVNLPIIEDNLALRFSGTKLEQKGYIDTRFREDSNNDDTEAFRAMLAWQVSDALKASFMYMRQDTKTDGRNAFMDQEIALPNSPTLNGGPVPTAFNTDLSQGRFYDTIDIYNLKLEYVKDWGTITATTSLFERATEFDRDASAEIEIITGGAFPADGAGRSLIIQPQDREVLSSEVRFASTWNSPVQVLVGGFYQEEDRDFRSAVITVDSETGVFNPSSLALLDRTTFTEVDEMAVFGELSWDVTDKFNLTGGIRWFDFDLSERAVAVTGFPGRPGSGPGPLLEFAEDDTIFKANASYRIRPDVLAYVQFAEGFRSGGTNDQTAASIAGVAIPAGFGSDKVENYEIGLKSSWFDRRLVVNGAVYRLDWTDIQVRQQATAPGGLTFAFRGNGGEAQVDGLELDLQAFPSAGLQLGMSFNYNFKAELTEDLPVVADGREGDSIPYVPDFSFSLNGRYERELGRMGLTGFIGGDVAWVDDQTNRFRPTDIQFREISSYNIMNFRVGVEGDSWSAVLAVKNALDEDTTLSYIFNGGNQPATGFVPPGMVRPWARTVDLTFRKSFDSF